MRAAVVAMRSQATIPMRGNEFVVGFFVGGVCWWLRSP